MSATPPLSALLLCGGASRRFGREKGLAVFHGRPLAARLLLMLEQISDDVRISTNQPTAYRRFGKPLVADEIPGVGPLGGLHAGLAAARHDHLAVVAVDMPFASARLLRALAELAGSWDIVVPTHRPSTARGTEGDVLHEPLHAIYHRRCRPAVEAVIAEGEQKVARLYSRVGVRKVAQEEWEALTGLGTWVFENVNSPADLERLQKEGHETRDPRSGA